MSTSPKKTPAKKRSVTSKKKTASKKFPAISRKNLIVAAVALVALVVILIIAFAGPKNPPAATPPAATIPAATPSGPNAAELVDAAPGKMTILCDVKLTLGYDENGSVIALTGDSEPARKVASDCEIVGLSCADAMAVILPTLEGERTQMRTYITIRQDQTGVNPGETFMQEVGAAAKAATEIPVVVIGISDMDENGYFDQDMARRCVRAALGDRAEITHLSEMYEGQYLATVTLGDVTEDYLINVEGTVTPDREITDAFYDESFHEGMGELTGDNPNQEEEKAEDENQEDSTTEEEKKEEAA